MIKEGFKERLKDVATLKGSSHSAAFGFALGTFLAILPTFGFGAFIGLILVLIIRKINKLALFLSFVIWNPLILVLFYPVSFGVGHTILENSEMIPKSLSILQQFFVYSKEFIIGSVILASLIAIISYFIVFLLVDNYKKRKAKRNAILSPANR